MKPFYSNFRIKNKIFSVSLLLLIIFGLLGLVTFQYFTNLYEKRIYEESADMLQLSSSVVDKELNLIEELSFQVSTDTVIQNYLKTINENRFSFESYDTKVRLLERMLSYASARKYIASMQIIDLHGETHTTGFDTSLENDTGKIRRVLSGSNGGNVWTKIEGENGISSARYIRKKANLSLQEMGTLVISIDMDTFVEETLNFSPENKDMVITSQHEIFYQSSDSDWEVSDFANEENDSGYMIESIDGEKYLLTYSRSNFSQLTYHHLLPYGDIQKQTNAIKVIMIVCFLLMLTLTVLLSKRAANNISKPLEALSSRMKKVQQGDFSESSLPEKFHDDEIGELHDNFQLMLNRINELIKENYTKQLMIQETEYKALQAQINPHFLYNTLDSINWLAKVNKQEKISVMADALGNMMRNIISKKAPMITIKEELEIVCNYITIQTYRYEHRLNFSLDVEEEYKNSKIPKLSIQPIVENAIQHGLEEMIEECRIHLSITESGEDLEIAIKDNGPGIETGQLEGIYRGEIRSKSSGIGLNNINERIKMMYGKDYGLEIDSEVGAGTTVRIRLPYMTE